MNVHDRIDEHRRRVAARLRNIELAAAQRNSSDYQCWLRTTPPPTDAERDAALVDALNRVRELRGVLARLAGEAGPTSTTTVIVEGRAAGERHGED